MMSLGWQTMFLPGFVLNLLCRRERGHKLENAIQEDCRKAEAIVAASCQLDGPDGGSVDYEALRGEWTTVFSTTASGADAVPQTSEGGSAPGAQPFTAGELIQTLIGYPYIELVTPDDNTLNTLKRSIRH